MSERAVVADGAGGFAVREIEVDLPGRGEVAVRLAASGVCHTDRDLADGATVPQVLGHEGAGTVTAVGPEVNSVAVGDRVMLTWAIACGACLECRRGQAVLCTGLGLGPGGQGHPNSTRLDGLEVPRAFNLGTMSTMTIVRAEAVIPLSDGVPFRVGALLGCGVMTGFGSVANVARVRAGESVAVLGTGGVGLNAIQAARICGADPIIALDVRPAALDRARAFGATAGVLVDPRDDRLMQAAAEVHKLTGGGADHAFECTAIPHLAAEFLRLVRHGGKAVAVSGVEREVNVDMRLFEWNKTYINPLYGGCEPGRDFPVLQRLYLEGRLMLDELVTQTYPLEEAAAAFADLGGPDHARGVLLMGDG